MLEEPQDITAAIDKAREFNGVYYVMMAPVSPLSDAGSDHLKIKGLFSGCATGVNRLGIKVTGIAMGLPVASDLDYADEITMHRALEGRREL